MSDLTKQLQRQAERLEFSLAPESAEALVDFLHLLARFNERIRLTGSSDLQVLVQRHLPDTFAAAALLLDESAAEGRCIDVGSGGGLPALPLALVLERLQLTLVEANQRKCVFLRTAVFDLGLSQRVEVLSQRLEQVKIEAGYDVACSRATWAPAQWLAHGAPLVRPHGLVLVFATDKEALPAELPEGLSLKRDVAYRLDDGAPRLIAAYSSA